jgi:nitroreductase
VQEDGSLEVQDNFIIDLIKRKHATRRFLDKAVDSALIRRIVDAGRRAGSWKNSQPWRFIAITDPDLREQIAATNSHAHHIKEAAFGIAVVGMEPSPSGSPQLDYGRAIQNMMLAAEAYGIGSVIGYVSEVEKTSELLDLPEGFRVAWLVSFGYPQADKASRVGHQRKPLEDLLHWNGWQGQRTGED